MANQLLRQEREQRGWSQARVAEQIGSDPGTISRWERGSSSPSPFFRERLCQLYGKTAGELGLLDDTATGSSAGATTIAAETRSENAGAGETALVTQQNAEKKTSTEIPNTVRGLACFSIAFGWMSSLLVLLVSRANTFVNFYALQSLLVFGAASVLVSAIIVALPIVAGVPVLRAVVPLGGILLVLFTILVWGISLLQAARGKQYRFPLIGNYCARLATQISTTRTEFENA